MITVKRNGIVDTISIKRCPIISNKPPKYPSSAPIAIPTTYDSVKISELSEHNIKMVIYANQTLRTAHSSMFRLLKEMNNAERISDVTEKMSSMQEIFELQEMYDIKNKEKDLERELKKLGYIN